MPGIDLFPLRRDIRQAQRVPTRTKVRLSAPIKPTDLRITDEDEQRVHFIVGQVLHCR
jgi:hypothetical protein